METIQEIIDAFKKQLQERLGNPLLGAFMLAWCAFNFRTILVIFGDAKVDEKLAILDGPTFASLWSSEWWWRNGWGPGLMALSYVFFGPWISFAVHAYTARMASWQAKDQKSVAMGGAAFLTKEEGDALLAKLADLEADHEEESEAALAERAGFRSNVASLHNSVNSARRQQEVAERRIEELTARFGSLDETFDLPKEVLFKLPLDRSQASHLTDQKLTHHHLQLLSELDSETLTPPTPEAQFAPEPYHSLLFTLHHAGLVRVNANGREITEAGRLLARHYRGLLRGVWASPLKNPGP